MGFHFLILFLKLSTVVSDWSSSGIVDHIFGPKCDKVSKP